MGLRAWLLRQAALRPRVLVITSLYGTRVRLLVEAEIARRGWPVAASPAEAGMVVVCGEPGAELAAAVQVIWEDVSGPRVLVALPSGVSPGEVVAALDGAVRELGDEGAQRRDAEGRNASQPSWLAGARSGDTKDAGHADHAAHSRGHADHAAHSRGHEGHAAPDAHSGGHEGHMGMPGGIAMAQRGADRDGLRLDRLHVPLGPVLVDWPAGLVVETVLQGDVIQEAVVRVVRPGGVGVSFWDEPWARDREVGRAEVRRRTAAAHLDSLGRLLGVAGWPGAARDARDLRDRLLAGTGGRGVRRDYARFAGRVRRSRVLRWMLRGHGVIGGDGPEWLRGDVLERAYRWVDRAGAAIDDLDDPEPAGAGDGDWGRSGGEAGVVLSLLPGLLAGVELGVARLVVASLDPDLDQVAGSSEVARG